jgi:hypothetical protein
MSTSSILPLSFFVYDVLGMELMSSKLLLPGDNGGECENPVLLVHLNLQLKLPLILLPSPVAPLLPL